VAGHHVPGVEPDPHAEALAEALLADPGVEPRQAHVTHLERRRQGAVGVVVLDERRLEHGDDPVAHGGHEGPAVIEDRVAHLTQLR
jgi:hypothetical protein